MTVLGVCLIAATTVFVPGERFTLAWTHSIEKVRWEEDYRVVAGPPPALQATAARVRGSAAGMEPPAGAVLRDGWYEYTPPMLTPAGLVLTRSGYAADYDWCVAGRCRPMAELIAPSNGLTRLEPCTDPAAGRTDRAVRTNPAGSARPVPPPDPRGR